ncbi:MAG: DUF4173 domain-containing protein [Anaerolineales bacterium]|nr:DUF4173 domain-containing protein [Anaerolineales bacterium]
MKKQIKRKQTAKTPVAAGIPASIDIPTITETVEQDVNAFEFNAALIKFPGRLILLALGLGWLFDFLFWEQDLGVNFAVFISLVVVVGTTWLMLEGKRPKPTSLLLLIPFLFFATFTFISNEPLTRTLAFVGVFFSAGVLTSTFTGGRWLEYGLLDYCANFFRLIAAMLGGGISFAAETRKYVETADGEKPNVPVWGLVRGLLLALPIVICFGSLLAAGDLVFNQKLKDFFDFEDFGEFVQRLITVLFWAYVLLGVYRYAALFSKDNNLIREGEAAVKPFLGFTETTVILASVSLLFMIFVSVQFQYFFGGQTNIGVEGYTYSQYARRGFNELVIVAFLSLVLVLGLSSLTRRETNLQKRVYSWLSAFLVALVLVILISAYQRISLAIDWHGFSRLRLYPRIFLVWLAILLVTVIVLEVFRKERYFAFAAVIASLGFAATLSLTNVDAAIVKRNTPRALTGKLINVGHLASLSTDAVPALVDEFLSTKYSVADHEKIGAALTCQLYFMSVVEENREDDSKEDSKETRDWRSFILSQYRADEAMQRIEPALQEYGINDDRRPVRVRTPGGELYDCRYYGYQEED